MLAHKINVILFDGFTLTLCEITDDDTLADWHKLIKCKTMQGLTNTELGHRYGIDLFLDDNGKLFGQDTLTGIFVRNGSVVDTLVGNLVFARHDDEGDATSCDEDDMLRIAQHIREGSALHAPDGYPWKVSENILVLEC